MKRWLTVLALAAAVAGLSGAQDSGPVPGAAGKAPRTVYFAPARPAAVLDSEGNALLRSLPEMLASSIAVRQPISRGSSAEAAPSVITVAAATAAGGRVSVTVSLLEGGTAKKTVAFESRSRSLDLAALRGFVEEAASQLAPLLEPVDAATDLQRVMASDEYVETTRQAEYLAQLDKRWEFTLWMSGFLRLIDSTGMDSNGSYFFSLGVGPLIAEATWFFTRDMGVQLSLYFNQTDAFDFGSNSRGNASGIFLFPGIGFVYRTVGQISAEYAVTLSAGWIQVSANNGDVKDRNGTVVVPNGSSVWSAISPRVRLSPALVWCITPSIALKGGIAFDIIAPGMFPWHDSPLGELQFLSIGLAYRL
jgi:hypothetical protein